MYGHRMVRVRTNIYHGELALKEISVQDAKQGNPIVVVNTQKSVARLHARKSCCEIEGGKS